MTTTVQGLAPGPSDVAPAGSVLAPAPTSRPGATRATPHPSASGGTRTDHLLLVLMALIWGVNFSVLKVGTRYVDPATFNGARVLLATVVLGTVAAFRGARRPSRADVVRLVLLGVLGHGIYQLCFIEGLARTASGATALILAGSPALIGIVGRLLGVERPNARAWGGIALQLAGMTGVVFGAARASGVHGASTSATTGVLLVLAASLAWSVYVVLLKPLTRRVDGVQLAAWTLVGGALTLGAWSVPAILRGALGALPALGWAAMLYSGVLALSVAYLFYYRGVRTVGAVRTAMYSNLQPVVALGVGVVALGERPGVWQLAGAALIGAGLVTSRDQR